MTLNYRLIGGIFFMEDIHLSHNIVIPSSALQFRFSRSSGKGGQNVNKVSTKVELCLNIGSIRCPNAVQKRIETYFRSRMRRDNNICVVSQESRSQWENKQRSIEKLVRLIERASRVEKKRIPTGKTSGANERRLTRKKERSETKRSRMKRIAREE